MLIGGNDEHKLHQSRRGIPVKYISVILLISFSVTSSYAAVGLETTPIRPLADDLEVGGADEWWVRQWSQRQKRMIILQK